MAPYDFVLCRDFDTARRATFLTLMQNFILSVLHNMFFHLQLTAECRFSSLARQLYHRQPGHFFFYLAAAPRSFD